MTPNNRRLRYSLPMALRPWAAILFFPLITPPLACCTEPEASAWRSLSPLPDPVGFGGMFAGVSHGILFAGGGSRFPDKPVWAGGKKAFSDKVFALFSPKGSWRELPGRLPEPLAHAACTSCKDGIIFAGGMNDRGILRNVYRVRFQGDGVLLEKLEPLPHPLVYAAAAVAGDVLYMVGGESEQGSTVPERRCWALPLNPAERAPEWRRIPDFPGRAGILMTAGSNGKCLFVFGGMHYVQTKEGQSRPQPLSSAYRYDPAGNSWTRLKEMPVPRVGAATPSVQLPDGDFLVAGGYGLVFPGPPEKHPGFERETLLFSPEKNAWHQGPPLPCYRKIDPNLPSSPGPEPMVGAPAVLWQGMLVLISGEVRPATRTPAVIGIRLDDLQKALR